MEVENYNLSVLDLKGLFCGFLSRQLENGTITKQFLETMKKRGVLPNSKLSKRAEQYINFMIHGDKDFFAFNSSLVIKQNTMSSVEKLRQEMIKEETERLAADSEEETE